MLIEITGPESEQIYHALHMWANYIETGDVCLSLNDAITMEKKPKITDDYQKGVILQLRKLAGKVAL